MNSPDPDLIPLRTGEEGPRHAPNRQNYVRFAIFTILLFWSVYVIEALTPLRFGSTTRDALSWIVPAIATPVTIVCTWWRYWRAKVFAAGAIQVFALVTKIARSGVGVHRRVRLRYEYNERTYERSVPLYDSVVCKLQVGSYIPVLISRHNPKRVQVPLNMEWLG